MIFPFRRKPAEAPAPAPRPSPPAPARAVAPREVWQGHLTALEELSDDVLRARMAETVAWCDALSSIRDFRSPSLTPILFHEGHEHLVNDLGSNRQALLWSQGVQVDYEAPVVAAGRFMLYFPDENLSDGYACDVSNGFFDVQNVPAYDTWVSFFRDDLSPRGSAHHCLLGYVPPSVIDLADLGIEGNPESCIIWLEQSDEAIRHRVEALLQPAAPR